MTEIAPEYTADELTDAVLEAAMYPRKVTSYEQKLWDKVAMVFMKEDLKACISTCVDINIEALFDCAFGNADKFMTERAKRIKEKEQKERLND